MPATKISIHNAKPEKLFYVVANVIVYRKADNRCLVLQRDPREKVHPGKYAFIGGKLEWKDLDIAHPGRINGEVLDYPNAVEELLAREAREEAGITIGAALMYINSVAYVRPDETPTCSIKFVAECISGEVTLEEGAFINYAWVNEEEVKELSCVDGIEDEVAQAIRLMCAAL